MKRCAGDAARVAWHFAPQAIEPPRPAPAAASLQ